MLIRWRRARSGSSPHVDKPHGGGIAWGDRILVAIRAPRRQAAWRPFGITTWLHAGELRGGNLKNFGAVICSIDSITIRFDQRSSAFISGSISGLQIVPASPIFRPPFFDSLTAHRDCRLRLDMPMRLRCQRTFFTVAHLLVDSQRAGVPASAGPPKTSPKGYTPAQRQGDRGHLCHQAKSESHGSRTTHR
jgi:hypothetical protein